MAQQDDEVHIDSDDARGGSNEGVVRWMLVIGLLLAIGLLTVVWMSGAAEHSDDQEEVAAENRIDVNDRGSTGTDGTATDSIVSEGADEMDAVPAVDAPETTAETIEN